MAWTRTKTQTADLEICVSCPFISHPQCGISCRSNSDPEVAPDDLLNATLDLLTSDVDRRAPCQWSAALLCRNRSSRCRDPRSLRRAYATHWRAFAAEGKLHGATYLGGNQRAAPTVGQPATCSDEPFCAYPQYHRLQAERPRAATQAASRCHFGTQLSRITSAAAAVHQAGAPRGYPSWCGYPSPRYPPR